MALRQRKKGEPIRYKGADDPIPLPWGGQEGSQILSLPPTLVIDKITATPQDWRTLYHLALADPEYLGNLLVHHVIRPVYEKFLSKEDFPLPRGIHAKPEDQDPYVLGLRDQFMWDARNYAAAAYTVIRHWRGKPREEWPLHFIKPFETIVEKTGHDKDKVDVLWITSALLEERFNGRWEELGLIDPEGFLEEDFRDIYLLRNHIDAAESAFEKMQHKVTIDELYEMIS
jgi:hypothetical protein